MVYLICFDKKYKHARHYLGYCADTEGALERRIEKHRKGQGARLIGVVVGAGIGFQVVRTWPNKDRNFERKLKNRKEGPRLCPHCVAEKKAAKAIKCPVVEKAKDLDIKPVFDTIKALDLAEGKMPIMCVTTTPLESPQMTHDEAFKCTFFDKKLEVANAQSQSDTNPSRWKRIWLRLARFFRL